MENPYSPPEGAKINDSNFKSLSVEEKKWMYSTEKEQLIKIEAALDSDVRPFLRREGGNISVRALKNGKEVHVQYNGACHGCAYSTSGTLSFIQHTLRQKVFKGIEIVPV